MWMETSYFLPKLFNVKWILAESKPIPIWAVTLVLTNNITFRSLFSCTEEVLPNRVKASLFYNITVPT